MAKHSVVVLISSDICEISSNGENLPIDFSKEEYNQYGISKNIILNFTADSKEECLKKLRDKINAFKLP